ncbi:ABC transporter permease [Occallatibacter riparius]|uniref:ABC transporter permease n=1 Tax=Occallatibacter riparius TaxID=1002689 RepID=A0A9J7BKI1_9BACT|nr:ABC transporter permease [Occallatibacter riparius]UWZ83099.1 ABC transporter permease [Occallatibacter riparius]
MSWTLASLQNFGDDVRFSLRQFRRAPGYAAFTVLVLALGVGTVTAMFAICYAVLLKPLPFEADQTLFQPVAKTTAGTEPESFSYNEIKAWQTATEGTADLAFSQGGLNIADGPAGAVLITEVNASQNLFQMLGARPMMGRGFLPDELEGSGSDVVILSHALWQQNFAGNKDVLGKTLHIGGVPRTVVGVMPPQFMYPLWENRPEAWVPIDRSELGASNKDAYSYFTPLLRVEPGASTKAVETQLAQAHAPFAKANDAKIQLSGLRELLVTDVRPALLALEVAVIVVWLIACSNVAGLLLARVVSRRSEIAVRAALGAARSRIVAQFLTESLALSCISATGGLGLAVVMLHIFRRTLSEKLPLGTEIHLNWAVWTSLLALTIVTTLAFGAVPALIASRTHMDAGLKSSGRKSAGDRGQNRIRSALLVGQIALSITLLIGAGLMMRTMYALRHVPLGFRTDHLVLTSLTIPNDLYKDRNAGTAVWQPLLDEIRRLPGVRDAALSTVLPIQHPVELITAIYATEWMKGDGSAAVRAATPGLVDALGVHMRTGRFFNDGDTATSLPVMVVNQTFVNRYLGGGKAVGRQIRYGHVPRTATIVGVIEDVHQDGVAEESQPEFYLSMSQLDQQQQIYRALLGRFMQVAVRTETAPGVLIPELRQGIHRANPHLAIGACSTMAEAVEDSIGAQKVAAHVIAVFGGLVLLITVVGLYGLLSYMVAQRTQEIGIRMALGADRRHVVGMVLRQTLIWLGTGTVIGIALAIVSGRLLNGFLFGVRAIDPWTIGLVSAGLFVCGMLAAMPPARRAASSNPVDALRAE